MPQLVKGGKWTFGWIVIDTDGRLPIPSHAWEEYGFSAEKQFIAIPASRTSGGFSLTTRDRLKPDFPVKVLGEVVFEGKERLRLSQNLMERVQVKPGDKLLTVRGSRYALGLVTQGPIVEEAMKHPDLEVFQIEAE